jgi:hypothetical protein
MLDSKSSNIATFMAAEHFAVHTVESIRLTGSSLQGFSRRDTDREPSLLLAMSAAQLSLPTELADR